MDDKFLRLGSPPPMRGKAKPKPKPAAPVRITPAHAGKRQAASAQSVGWQDHPRPCGEKRYMSLRFGHTPGSPPPMRGKDCCPRNAIGSARITPAHAGKSTSQGARA